MTAAEAAEAAEAADIDDSIKRKRFGVSLKRRIETMKKDKVITVVVIRLLNSRTYCVQSVFAYLGL